MTIKRNNKISIIKSILFFLILITAILIYKIIIYSTLVFEAEYKNYEIAKEKKEIIAELDSLKIKNEELKIRNDYIVRNTINLDSTRNKIERVLNEIEENIIVDRTNTRIMDLNIVKIERVRDENDREYLNYVDVLIEVNNIHKFNTDEHAMLRLKKIIEIPSIKKVLNPVELKGKTYFYKDKFLAFRIYKEIT